jgi:hypothetical protein
MLVRRTFSALVIAVILLTIGGCSGDQGSNDLNLQGVVESNGVGLQGYTVALYASFVSPTERTAVLGSDVTNSSGEFEINYTMPPV